jgi:hypothetical protein
MKTLPEQGQRADWQHSLIDDLAYIKANLRYPARKKTIMPMIFWGGLILVIGGLITYLQVSQSNVKGITFVLAVSALIPFIVTILTHWKTLQFTSISSDFHLAENCVLMESFLKSQHLAFGRHPEIPEVFQIISRNLSAGKEDREVLIFIADDKRILINSHFTNVGFGLFPGKRHHMQMARMLREYINNRSTGTGVMHQTF